MFKRLKILGIISMSTPANVIEADLSQTSEKRLKDIIQALAKEKKNTVLMVVDCVDALGDFKHFREFFLKLKKCYPLLNVVGIIGAWASNAPICHKIMAFLKTPEAQSASIWISIDCETDCKGVVFRGLDKAYQESIFQTLIKPYQDSKTFLKKLDESIACVIHVSTTLEFKADKSILMWLYHYRQSNQPSYFFFPEYGKKNGTHNMGLGPKDAGIRLREDWAGEITLERKTAALSKITHIKFLQLLTNKEAPTEENLKEYLQKRKIFVADLRDAVSITQFVLTQIQAYQETQFGLDFYVPHRAGALTTQFQVLQLQNSTSSQQKQEGGELFNPSIELEQLMKIPKSEYTVIDSENTNGTLTCRFRFFTNKIALEDEDYDALCFCADSIGYTGDDGATKALSALSLPFGIHYTYPIKKDFRKEIIEKAKQLKCGYFVRYLELIEKNLLGEIAVRTELVATAVTLGTFIRENYDRLMAELTTFRTDLYQNCNVFQHLPTLLLRTLPKAILPTLNKVIPPESQTIHWKYDGKGIYWLKVINQERYVKLTQTQDLGSAVTIRKIDKEEAFCVYAPAEAILPKLVPSKFTKQ